MARAIWSGSLSFGLVNIPVKLFPATSPKEVRFHLVHDADGARVRNKRVCSGDGQEVPYEHIAKGYELSPGKYVVFAKEELEALDPKATRGIDIERFVSLSEIDPIYYQTTYHLVPDKGAAKAYALLHQAMAKAERVGLARMVLRTKQYLCAVRPMEGALSVSTMLFADEVIHPSQLEHLPHALPPHALPPKGRELEMALQLIASLSGKFDPGEFSDEYREKVLEAIEKKSQGEEIVAQPQEKEGGRVLDLMTALKASLAKGERRAPRAHAARKATAGKSRR